MRWQRKESDFSTLDTDREGTACSGKPGESRETKRWLWRIDEEVESGLSDFDCPMNSRFCQRLWL
ncbi:hypothetical protein PVK06_001507 [Gossypium arboreum]|uniref:Uncharacterized protein n=1 Tax=Gossypium arboreum TaxID=29729 RepID=A0ABR0R157_GOSAR|nr:hypothetical protein PVK06_001507 [Gossypium arboreum]